MTPPIGRSQILEDEQVAHLPPLPPWKSSSNEALQPMKRCGAPSEKKQKTFQCVSEIVPGITHRNPLDLNVQSPVAVTIGPCHRTRRRQKLKKAKNAAVKEFCRVADLSREAVLEKIRSMVASARSCYDVLSYAHLLDWVSSSDDDDPNKEKKGGPANSRNNNKKDRESQKDLIFAEMMLLDGCFLVQFMVDMCPASNSRTLPEADSLLIRRAEVQTRIDAIARDIMLLENQIPWSVLQILMEIRPPNQPKVPVDRFLDLMASVFNMGNKKAINTIANDNTTTGQEEGAKEKQERGKQQLDMEEGQLDPPPDHLFALFYRRQVGAARTQSLSVPMLSAVSTTSVELAEMGIKLTASKTREFGDMSVKKRKHLGLFGELSLSPLVLNPTTACWLINMAAYEASMGATQGDNFAVSSYVCLVALLMNRKEDVQELRSKGIVNSEFSNQETLDFFKWAARLRLHVGHRYYQVFEQLQEYKQERYAWIAVHRFFYKHFKAIAAIFSIAGVLAGLFRAILSLKQPQQS